MLTSKVNSGLLTDGASQDINGLPVKSIGNTGRHVLAQKNELVTNSFARKLVVNQTSFFGTTCVVSKSVNNYKNSVVTKSEEIKSQPRITSCDTIFGVRGNAGM